MTDSSAEVSLAERLWYIECIKQTKARYFRFIDTKQWPKLRQVFTDDCTFDGLWATGDCPDGFIASISKNLAQLRTIHHGCMPEIEVTSPTTARGIWPMEDYLEAISGSMGYRGVSVEGQRGAVALDPRSEGRRLLRGAADAAHAGVDLQVHVAGPPAVQHATGADPILVVSTKYDPATPYEWGVQVASELDNATLLTFDGDGHTAYTSGSTCIDDAVDAYLLSGTMPAEGTVCTADAASGTGA